MDELGHLAPSASPLPGSPPRPYLAPPSSPLPGSRPRPSLAPPALLTRSHRLGKGGRGPELFELTNGKQKHFDSLLDTWISRLDS
jgi:hypothetical protein